MLNISNWKNLRDAKLHIHPTYHNYVKVFLLLLTISLAFLDTVSFLYAQTDQDIQHAVTQSRRTAIVTAVERASPAVVNISAIRSVSQQTSLDEWFWREFWGEMPSFQKRSLREVGSGVIINKQGYILTNHHVIEDAEKIKVAVADGREFDANIEGYDFLSDLALLKVDTKEDLPVIKWGDSDDLLIGEWALAIGNPFGLSIGSAQPTVTVGIVSATQRSLIVEPRFYDALIQTDASVNPGNSGGALVNALGELIGINTVIRSTSGGSQGVGFAIPVNKAKTVLEKIKQHGYIVPPYLGVEIQPITEEMSEKLLDKKESQNSTLKRGVLVSKLDRNSPLSKAGIKRGDIIQAISGRMIKDATDFKAVVRLLPKDFAIKFDIIRRGQKRSTSVRLSKLEWDYIPQRWGLTLTQPKKDNENVYRPGVIITNIDRNSGLVNILKKGDIIYQINDITIHTLEVFKIVDSRIHAPTRIRLYFERNGEQKSIPVTFNRNYNRR